MARALLEAGATVAVSARPTSRLDEVVASWRTEGLAAEALAMDVSDPQSVEAAAAALLDRWDGLDLVVNNAGIGMRTVNPDFHTDPRPFFEVSPEGFAAVVATNFTGYFLVARAFAPYFVDRRRGRFVNITVNYHTMVRRGYVPYGPSRAGSEALSQIMTEDLRPYGVSVNLLLPGGRTATGMIPEQTGRDAMLQPEVMGPAIVFLASDEAEGLTGERIVANEFESWLAEYRRRPAPTSVQMSGR